jgi:mono/diheme cytochrome c family protein
MSMRFRIALYALFLSLLTAFAASPSRAAERVLTLTFGDEIRRLTAEELLARPDAAFLTIPNDVTYRRAVTYRAVPLATLIGEAALIGFDTIESRASDGFVSQIPAALVRKGAEGGSVAWVAIEDPAAPWPNLPGQETSGGPFYLVWEHPERSGVATEQWPFALVALTGVADPVHRWPQLAVDPALPDTAPERLGQTSFIRNCMPCHRLKGAGLGEIGPDLGAPMNATHYITPAGLRALIRDPKAVRTWPGQQMMGFNETQIPDAELDALIAFLAHMAKR